VVHALARDPEYIKKTYGLDFVDFGDIYHYAAIVGGRAKIDGDPMMVALDLSIDAEFFITSQDTSQKESFILVQVQPIQ
jgi:UDP-glucose 4-epimerase